MELMGHSEIDTTLRYAKVTDSGREAISKHFGVNPESNTGN